MNPQLQSLQRRLGRFPIEFPAAAMLAAAVAFATLALPQWRFEQAISASGLPGLVAAAAPPLGQTARTLAALFLAALSFAAVVYGLKALDRRPAPSDFPAFRAADLHPDAPKRRPILAGAEFGAPADDVAPLEKQPARGRVLDAAESLPSFMAPQPPAIGDFVPEPRRPAEPATPSARAPMVEPVDAEFEASEEIEPARSATIDPFEAPIPARTSLPSFLDSNALPSDPDFDWEEPVRVESQSDEREPAGLAELMARLESGLARNGGKPVPAMSGAASAELARAFGTLDRATPSR